MEDKFTINEQKVLTIFFNSPLHSFSAREIARLTKVSHPTILTALQKLKKINIVKKEIIKNKSKVGQSHGWKANQENSTFKEYKKIHNLKSIYLSNIIKKIAEETSPNVIVLFGSFSRGEDIEESDIDLFVQSKEKDINLKAYEHKLGRKINITFASDPKDINKELLQNIINGIVLYGYLEVI